MQNLMKTKTCFEPFKYFILTRIHLRRINIILHIIIIIILIENQINMNIIDTSKMHQKV